MTTTWDQHRKHRSEIRAQAKQADKQAQHWAKKAETLREELERLDSLNTIHDGVLLTRHSWHDPSKCEEVHEPDSDRIGNAYLGAGDGMGWGVLLGWHWGNRTTLAVHPARNLSRSQAVQIARDWAATGRIHPLAGKGSHSFLGASP